MHHQSPFKQRDKKPDLLIVNFPLIFKLGLTMHAISLLITTHEYFYSMQRNIKLRNKSQHHITIMTQLFWVWKPQDGKTIAAARYRFYYEKI